MSGYKSTLQSEEPDEIGGRQSDAAGTKFNMDDWRKIFHEEPSTIGSVPDERVHIEQELQTFMETLDAADDANTFDDVQELQVLIKTETIDDDGDEAFGISKKMKKKLSKKKAAGKLHQKKAAGTLQQKPKVKKRILRRRLDEYSFVQKLYLATNSHSIDFVHWSKRGKHLIVQYMALQEHLTSSRSIFRCRSVLQFAEELEHHGFMRVLDYDLKDPAKGTIVLVFQHPNFLMGMPKKLRQISNLNIQEAQENEQKQNDKDICAAFHSYLSPLQAARCRLHTELSYHFDMALLQEHANAPNKPVAKRAGRPAQIVETTVEQQLMGKTDKFVNPYESVAKILTKQVPSYAGYYGNVPLPKLQDFFQEYMPRYGIKISGYKQIVIDGHNKSSDFNQNLPIGIDYSDEENDDPAKKETFDLEQVMQQLCDEDGDAISSNTPNSSSSTVKSKEKPNPKTIKSKQKLKQSSKMTELLESSSTSSSSSSDDDDDEELDEDSAALEIVLNENNGTYKFIKKTKAQEMLPNATVAQKGSMKRQNEDDQEKAKEPLTKKSKKLQTPEEPEVMRDDNEETLEETVQKNLKPFLQNGGDEEDGLMDFAGDDDDEDYIDQKVLRRTATLSAAKRRSYDLRKAKLSTKNK